MKKRIRIVIKTILNMYYYYTSNRIILSLGKNNKIKRAKSARILNSTITIQGKDNQIVINNNCNITGIKILVRGEGNVISFGDNVIINASKIQPTVINSIGGKKIIIGKGSLLSNNIEIHTTDYHGIYNKEGKRINFDKDIIIGENVWIGLGVKILKGSCIADNCIVGAGSIVNRDFTIPNTIIVGNPAKIVKYDVFWHYDTKPFM